MCFSSWCINYKGQKNTRISAVLCYFFNENFSSMLVYAEWEALSFVCFLYRNMYLLMPQLALRYHMLFCHFKRSSVNLLDCVPLNMCYVCTFVDLYFMNLLQACLTFHMPGQVTWHICCQFFWIRISGDHTVALFDFLK